MQNPENQSAEPPHSQNSNTVPGFGEEPKPALGVGSLVSDTFVIVFERWFFVILLGFVPTFAGQLISGALTGAALSNGVQTVIHSSLTGGFAAVAAAAISIASMSITFALLVQFAYDSNLHRSVSLKRYIATAFSTLLPNALLNIVTFLALGLVAVAISASAAAVKLSPVFLIPTLLIAMLWIYSVFCVTIPAVVLSREGYRSILRSIQLTKNYRWPIVGAITLTIAFIVILSVVLGFFVAFFGLAGGMIGLLLSLFVMTGVTALASGLLSVLLTLIYARLREIKEGLSIEQIAEVFE